MTDREVKVAALKMAAWTWDRAAETEKGKVHPSLIEAWRFQAEAARRLAREEEDQP